MKDRPSGSRHVCRIDSKITSPLIQQNRSRAGAPTFSKSCASLPCTSRRLSCGLCGYSITRSANAARLLGTMRFIAFAVFILMTNR
jgi:hypothetical protein